MAPSPIRTSVAKKGNQRVITLVVNEAALGAGVPVPGFGYPGDAVARSPVPLPEQDPDAHSNVSEGGRFYSPEVKKQQRSAKLSKGKKSTKRAPKRTAKKKAAKKRKKAPAKRSR